MNCSHSHFCLDSVANVISEGRTEKYTFLSSLQDDSDASNLDYNLRKTNVRFGVLLKFNCFCNTLPILIHLFLHVNEMSQDLRTGYQACMSWDLGGKINKNEAQNSKHRFDNFFLW